MGLSSRGGKMLITPSPVATTPVIQRLLSREYVETAIINLNGQFNILYIFYEDC